MNLGYVSMLLVNNFSIIALFKVLSNDSSLIEVLFLSHLMATETQIKVQPFLIPYDQWAIDSVENFDSTYRKRWSS